jgi:hypothetical protein
VLRLSLGLIVILAATSATAKPPRPKPLSADAPVLTKAAVKTCVDEVRDAGHDNFDAYYNEATRNVENNLPRNFVTLDDEATSFAFRKCMADAGFPLGSRLRSD